MDALHKGALGASGRDNGAPWPAAAVNSNNYGAFVLDPDGHNIEAAYHAPPVWAFIGEICYSRVMNWQENILSTVEQIRDLILGTKRIAVLGIKTDAQAGQPSVYVPKYMQDAGFEIVPVPVYYPDVAVILGEKVYRKLIDIPGAIDMVDVFRRPNDVTGHVDDIVAKKPHSVWLQSGIRNDAAAEIFAKAGIKVVQDR